MPSTVPPKKDATSSCEDSIVIAAFLVLVPFVVLLRFAESGDAPLKTAAWYGALTGAAISAVQLRWIPSALQHYTALAIPGFIAALIILAALWAVVGVVTVYLWRRQPKLPRWLVFAAVWTALEWTRSHLGGMSFPWLGLGTMLSGRPVLIQAAEVVGSRGLTFLLASANVLIADLIMDRRQRLIKGIALSSGVALVIGYGFLRIGQLRMDSIAVVGVVATGIPFNATAGELEEARDSILVWTERLAGQGVVVVTGPEASVPGVTGAGEFDTVLQRIAREAGVPVLAGDLQPVAGDSGVLFNAMTWFAPEARGDTVYRKRRLVPLVESSGTRRGTTAPLLSTSGGKAGVLICFESVFENLPREYRLAGADLLINTTNDAWGEGTSGPLQHALHLPLRAVETRTAIIRVSNRGVSFAVDPLGRIIEVHEKPGPYVMQVPLSNTVPPYVRWGDWVGVGSVIFAAAALLVSRK